MPEPEATTPDPAVTPGEAAAEQALHLTDDERGALAEAASREEDA